MDPELDTGAMLAQARFALGDENSWDELGPKLEACRTRALPGRLERIERGDPGEPQSEDGASYFSFFEPEYAWIDWCEACGGDRAAGSRLALPLDDLG